MPLEITDDGFAPVTIGDVTQTVDLYAVNNELQALYAETREALPDANAPAQTGAYLTRVCGMLDRLGFGTVSQRAADKFDAAIAKAVEELGKAEAGAPTRA